LNLAKVPQYSYRADRLERQPLFFSPTKPKTMNKIERIFDAVMHAVTLLAIAGGFYWIFVRFLITYLKTL